MRADPLGLLSRARALHGDFVKMHLGPYPIYLLFDPEHVLHVLQKNPDNYLKDGYEHLEPMVGRGLLSSEGELWRRQRRLIQPAFHKKRIEGMARTMTDATEAMLARWRERLRKGPDNTLVVDANRELSRLTLEIVGRTLFGSGFGGGAAMRGEEALALVFRLGFDRAGRFPQVPFGVPTPKNLRYRRAVRVMDEMVYSLIDGRRAAAGEARDPGEGDLLDMLLRARDGEDAMTEKQLRDEVLTILGAGYETTAKALCWTLYMLDENPEAARRLREELGDVLGGRAPTAADLPRLSYARMVVQESMRLFPPVWGLSRLLKGADEVGGHRIPKGNRVIISPYVTQRRPDLWPEPERFDPERFREATHVDRPPPGLPRYAYFPFSGGPRQCIGSSFASMEAVLVLATIAQAFELSVVPGHPVEPEPSFTLGPRHGLPMTLREVVA